MMITDTTKLGRGNELSRINGIKSETGSMQLDWMFRVTSRDDVIEEGSIGDVFLC